MIRWTNCCLLLVYKSFDSDLSTRARLCLAWLSLYGTNLRLIHCTCIAYTCMPYRLFVAHVSMYMKHTAEPYNSIMLNVVRLNGLRMASGVEWFARVLADSFVRVCSIWTKNLVSVSGKSVVRKKEREARRLTFGAHAMSGTIKSLSACVSVMPTCWVRWMC